MQSFLRLVTVVFVGAAASKCDHPRGGWCRFKLGRISPTLSGRGCSRRKSCWRSPLRTALLRGQSRPGICRSPVRHRCTGGGIYIPVREDDTGARGQLVVTAPALFGRMFVMSIVANPLSNHPRVIGAGDLGRPCNAIVGRGDRRRGSNCTSLGHRVACHALRDSATTLGC